MWKLTDQWRGLGIGMKVARTMERTRSLEEERFHGVTSPWTGSSARGRQQGQSHGDVKLTGALETPHVV